MTALSGTPDFRHFDRWFALTNRLRTEGTEHLLAAARASGVKRFVAQSFTGWSNGRDGSWTKTEDDPLGPHPVKEQVETLAAIKFLERAALDAPLEGSSFATAASTGRARRRRSPRSAAGGCS